MKNLLVAIVGLVLVSCNDCKVLIGTYGDGILSIKVDDKKVKGILDFKQGEPEVTCYLEFEFTQNEECNKSIELIDSFDNGYKGKVELKEKEIFIQSLEPLGACQRIIDLNKGESFSLDE